MRTGPLCQGPWVNTAADWDLQHSLADEKEGHKAFYSLPAFQSAQSLRCLPKSHVVYSSMWPRCASAKFSTQAECNHVLVRGSYQQRRKEGEKNILAAAQETSHYTKGNVFTAQLPMVTFYVKGCTSSIAAHFLNHSQRKKPAVRSVSVKTTG